MARAKVSTLPPGVLGTSMRIGRVGNACPDPFDKLRTGSVEADWASVAAGNSSAKSANGKYLILFNVYSMRQMAKRFQCSRG